MRTGFSPPASLLQSLSACSSLPTLLLWAGRERLGSGKMLLHDLPEDWAWHRGRCRLSVDCLSAFPHCLFSHFILIEYDHRRSSCAKCLLPPKALRNFSTLIFRLRLDVDPFLMRDR